MAAAEAKRLKEEAKAAKAKIVPAEMFRGDARGFTEFDDAGMPTKDKDGEPLKKSALKKLAKERAQQEKLHAQFLAKQG